VCQVIARWQYSNVSGSRIDSRLGGIADDFHCATWLIPHWDVCALIQDDPPCVWWPSDAALAFRGQEFVLRAPDDAHWNIVRYLKCSVEQRVEHPIVARIEASRLAHRGRGICQDSGVEG
jgi:hypothetical protein